MEYEDSYTRRENSRDRARSDGPESHDDRERESSKRSAEGDVDGDKRAPKASVNPLHELLGANGCYYYSEISY